MNAAVVVALFTLATAVALVARRVKLPYTVALVVAGLALGSAKLFSPPHLTKELLYTVFLPGLLYEAAYHVDFKKFWQSKVTVLSLAIPGLLVSVGLTTVVLVPVLNVSKVDTERVLLSEGLVFAALIAATDPIAVVALFKSVGAPKRLTLLVEGESLLNDGTAVVVFTLVLSFVLGKPTTAAAATFDFVRVVGMGLLVGAAVGYLVSFFIHKIDDPMLEITLTTIAAYGSFVLAEHFHFSGVIATVTAGMLSGNHAARTGMSASTRLAVQLFWEYLAFAMNSVVFLLIGFEVHVDAMVAAWKPIVIAYLAVTIGRAMVLYVVAFLLRRSRERIPLSWATVLTWGGLRGALSMVLVLGLPAELRHRELIVSMTFGVVVLSILIQGTTMAPLLRRLGLVGGEPGRDEYERHRSALRAGRAGLAEILRLQSERAIGPLVAGELRELYETRIAVSEAAAHELALGEESLREDERRCAMTQALQAEKLALVEAYRSGLVSEGNYEDLLADVDARLVAVDEHEVT